jgi:hypothetical protein
VRSNHTGGPPKQRTEVHPLDLLFCGREQRPAQLGALLLGHRSEVGEVVHAHLQAAAQVRVLDVREVAGLAR